MKHYTYCIFFFFNGTGVTNRKHEEKVQGNVEDERKMF